jgi:hypothetical protein
LLKRTQPEISHVAVPSRQSQQAALPGSRQVKSTAAILAQGVSLSEVQQAVRKLRPMIQQVS